MTDRSTSWTLRGQITWTVLTLVFCFLWAERFVDRFRPERAEVIDFYQEWSSAKNLLTGRPVYAPIAETFEPYLGMRSDGPLAWDINVHPPTSVLLAIPLAPLNYYDATLAWNLVSVGAMIVALWMIVRQLKIMLSIWSVLPLVCITLFASPIWQQVTQGQLNFVLALLVVGIWVADRHDRPLTAGALLGFATAIKLFPGFLILYFLLRRQWRAVVASAVSFAAFTAATTAVLGVEAYQTYIARVLPQAVTWKSTWNNASWPGLCAKLFNPENGHTSTTPLVDSPLLELLGTGLGWLVVLAALAIITWRAKSLANRDHAFGATVTAMLLLSPVTWEHYFVILIVPLALLWTSHGKEPVSRAIFVASCFVLCLPIYWLCDSFIAGGFAGGTANVAITLTLLSMQCYALILLFVQQVSLAWSREPKAQPVVPRVRTVTT